MANKYMDTTLFDRASVFAIKAHGNSERRGKELPYILHCMEAAEIVSTITKDQELLSAAILHDTVEDTDVTIEEIRAEFGDRISSLVETESEPPVEGTPEETWKARKQFAIDRLSKASREGKIVALGDKLSNMRAIAKDYDELGDALWERFHAPDVSYHEWHYRGLLNALSQLSDTEAYKEFEALVNKVFLKANKAFSFEIDEKERRVLVRGWLDGENLETLFASLSLSCDYVLDFSRVGHISYSGLRAFLHAYEKHYRLTIVNAVPDVLSAFHSTAVSRYIPITGVPRLLNMEDWTQSGDGFTALSYFNKDGDSMMKLYYDFMPLSVVEREKGVATSAMLFGIPTPMSGELVRDGKRFGVSFERVVGKRSFARILSEEPERLDELAEKYSGMLKNLHSKECDIYRFPNRKDVFRHCLDGNDSYTDEQKANILAFIDSVPDDHTCIHGDLHIGNVIMTEKDSMFIDMADFSWGNPLLDVGTTYFCMCNPDDAITQRLFHCTSKTTREFWLHFAKYYFGADTPEKLSEVDGFIVPYAALTALLFGTRYKDPALINMVINVLGTKHEK